mgnify:CR=1 FL=1
MQKMITMNIAVLLLLLMSFTDQVPPYLISQISGKPLVEKKMVLASSGVYYDRDELKRLVTSNPAVCIVTGKYLTEKPEFL